MNYQITRGGRVELQAIMPPQASLINTQHSTLHPEP